MLDTKTTLVEEIIWIQVLHYHRVFQNKSYVLLRQFRQNRLLRDNKQICSVSLYVPNSTVQNLSREANSSLTNSPHLMQPGYSLPYLQQPVPSLYPIQSRNSHPTSAKIHFKNILPFAPRSCKLSLSFRFSNPSPAWISLLALRHVLNSDTSGK